MHISIYHPSLPNIDYWKSDKSQQSLSFSLLERIVTNQCRNKVSEKFLSRKKFTVILCVWLFLSTLGHITTHTEVIGGPVHCPALHLLRMSPHQGVTVTNIECWVNNKYHVWTILLNVHRDCKNISDKYSLIYNDI